MHTYVYCTWRNIGGTKYWQIPAYETLAVINWRITKTVIMYYGGTYIINSFSAITLMDHMHTFSVQAMVRSYCVYNLWDAACDGDILLCKREIGNPHDPSFVAVKKESKVFQQACHVHN